MDARLEQLKALVVSATEGMSAEQMSRHAEGKWCAAEVLEHLYLTYTGTIKAFERVLEAGKAPGKTITLKQRFGTFVVLTLNHLPEGRKAPKTTEPRGMSADRIRAEVEEKIAAMDEIIARSEARLGKGKLLDHPILGPLSASEWRKFHLVHGRHHVKQIMKIREGSG
jgi:hypothetical protein